MARVHDLHDGRAYRADFGARMTGTGPFASLIAKRFSVAKRRLGFPGIAPLSCNQFMPPKTPTAQMDVFH